MTRFLGRKGWRITSFVVMVTVFRHVWIGRSRL
jgi:hypothetical protein